MIIKKILFLFICFLTLINISYAQKYRLLGDPDYYFDVNRDKFLYNDKFENVANQINNQYKGELNIKHRRPDFNLYEYDYTFVFGYNYGKPSSSNITGLGSTDYNKKYSANIGIGVTWSNNYKLEFEFIENKNRLNNMQIDHDLYLLTGTIDYYRYQANLRPYMSLSIGAMDTTLMPNYSKTEKSKEFIPLVVGGALGLEYVFLDAKSSIYIEAKYLKSLMDAEFKNNVKIGYDYFGIGLGVRVYIN